MTEYKSLKDNLSDDEILKLTATLEKRFSHPLAISILSKAREKELNLGNAENIHQETEIGLSGEIDNEKYRIVSETYLDKKISHMIKKHLKNLQKNGNSISYLLNKNDELLGFIAQGDEIKAESKDMIDSLKKHGSTPVILQKIMLKLQSYLLKN